MKHTKNMLHRASFYVMATYCTYCLFQWTNHIAICIIP